ASTTGPFRRAAHFPDLRGRVGQRKLRSQSVGNPQRPGQGSVQTLFQVSGQQQLWTAQHQAGFDRADATMMDDQSRLGKRSLWRRRLIMNCEPARSQGMLEVV